MFIISLGLNFITTQIKNLGKTLCSLRRWNVAAVIFIRFDSTNYGIQLWFNANICKCIYIDEILSMCFVRNLDSYWFVGIG